MPEEALVAEETAAETPVESLVRLMANAMAEAFTPELKESVVTPVEPAISSVTDLVMDDAWNRSAAVWADCSTFTTTGTVLCVPNEAEKICTSLRALVAIPLLI